MFDNLSSRLMDVFDGLRKRGRLGETDIDDALRQVRIALLEADVALPVVKDFIAAVRERAMGEEVVRSITPGQMVVKIVQDHLTEMLGGEAEAIKLGPPPAAILMVGLQGSGKTTTAAKLALRLKNVERKKTLMASTDTQRPAAQEQLAVLGREAGIATLDIVAGQGPEDIAKRAMETARLEGYDVVILDTAGRLHIDDDLMAEAERLSGIIDPVETLLVTDAMLGQDAVRVADEFHRRIGISGIVLTRVDGDARGGAALSARAVTGCPVKLIGVGEKLDALEEFHPGRIAQRILGMGDVAGLVEKAAETIDIQEAEKLAAKLKKGRFDFNDMRAQLQQMRNMGGLDGLMAMLPGAQRAKAEMAAANIDQAFLARQEAIIGSMTKRERENAKLLNASRKRRIAAGSGTQIQDVNRLIKQFKNMNMMMKKMGKMGKKGLMRQLPPGMMPR